jgi:predicted RNA binding protein YcfA (HicA-like mRNA interferase family)
VQKRQKGSHVILIKESGGEKIGCVVPLHKELKVGAIKRILKQAKVGEKELFELL